METNELDDWGLHVDCVEDCCWEARLERAGGPVEISAEAVIGLAQDGLIGLSEDEGFNLVVEFRYDALHAWERLDLELLALASEKLHEFRELPLRDSFHTRTGGMKWSAAADAAVAAWEAGLRSAADFSGWFDLDGDRMKHFRAQLMNELIARGVDPVEVYRSLRGEDDSWPRKLMPNEIRKAMERHGVGDWSVVGPQISSRPMLEVAA